MSAEYVEKLKQNYNFDKWQGQNRLAENLFVWKYFLRGNEFPGWFPNRNQQVKAPGFPVVNKSVWTLAETPANRLASRITSTDAPLQGKNSSLLLTDTYECESRLAAHEFLLRLLSHIQLPLINRQDEATIGDIVFTGPGTSDAIMLFARANLVFMIRNGGEKIVPVTGAASQLDSDLISKPSPPAGDARAFSPAFRMLDAPVQEYHVGDIIPLKVEALDPLRIRSAFAGPIAHDDAPGPVYYKVFASSDGEVFKLEERLAYQPKSPGVKNITVYAVNALQTASSESLKIDVK